MVAFHSKKKRRLNSVSQLRVADQLSAIRDTDIVKELIVLASLKVWLPPAVIFHVMVCKSLPTR